MPKNSSSDDLFTLVQPIAYKTAGQFAGRIPHLAFEDVAGELIEAQVRNIKQKPYRPYLKQVATNRAIDLVRKGKHRNHDELDRPVATGDDGDELTLGDRLTQCGHPELVTRSAEDEYFLIEAGQRIEAEIPERARRIGWQRLLGERSSDADNTYIFILSQKISP